MGYKFYINSVIYFVFKPYALIITNFDFLYGVKFQVLGQIRLYKQCRIRSLFLNEQPDQDLHCLSSICTFSAH